MPLSEDWRDQYQRMVRSYQRLTEAAGPSSMGSDEARDRLYHFFQDAYHLRDWLRNSSDPDVSEKGKELFGPGNHIKATPALALCADLCNGIKHLGRDRNPVSGADVTISRQDVAIDLPVIEIRVEVPGPAGQPRKPRNPEVSRATATHRWYVTFGSQNLDAVELAGEIIAEWEKWLTGKNLL